MIGILLGDGSIARKVLLISIHSKATDYIEKFSELIRAVFEYNPKFHLKKSTDIIEVKIHSVGIVESLVEVGLQIGDKVKNQVVIPQWIKENDSFFIASIRGLLDTDGYIGKYKKRNKD